MSEGLLDGSDQLRNTCREVLADTDLSFGNLPVGPEEQTKPPQSTNNSQPTNARQRVRNKNRKRAHPSKHRFGLPDGFEPRLQRYGRSVLLEFNIYRLPSGQEFIPCRPTGTLGASSHLYALLTADQYLKSRRGSVYVRTDGRIFDYSVDSSIPLGDLFDTGYTISDLERTGRYAPELRRPKKRRQQTRVKRAAAAG
jgi:hypothetical protein